MTSRELIDRLEAVARDCDDSSRQAFVQSILYSLTAAITAGVERELSDRTAAFSKEILAAIGDAPEEELCADYPM